MQQGLVINELGEDYFSSFNLACDFKENKNKDI